MRKLNSILFAAVACLLFLGGCGKSADRNEEEGELVIVENRDSGFLL